MAHVASKIKNYVVVRFFKKITTLTCIQYFFQGAFFGVNAGLAFILWIFIGSQIYSIPPQFLNKLPLSTLNCPERGRNVSFSNTTDHAFSSPLPTTVLPESSSSGYDLYFISYTLYTPLGFSCTLAVGIIVSLLTGTS